MTQKMTPAIIIDVPTGYGYGGQTVVWVSDGELMFAQIAASKPTYSLSIDAIDTLRMFLDAQKTADDTGT